jgi:alpha-methylacyl-CoA racemase
MILMKRLMGSIWQCMRHSQHELSMLTVYRGALEPRFFSALLAGLSLKESDLPGPREDRESWPALRQLFTKTFLSKTRREWEEIFDGTDACCTPILTHQELEEGKVKQRPFVTLRSSPSLAISANEGDIDEGIHGQGPGVECEGWSSGGLSPGVGGEETLKEWLGWKRGQQFDVVDGGLVLKTSAKL